LAKINGILNLSSRLEGENDIALVSGALRGFLAYLEANRAKYFTSKNYVEASEEYLARAEERAEGGGGAD
jgi:hypothetical protein